MWVKKGAGIHLARSRFEGRTLVPDSVLARSRTAWGVRPAIPRRPGTAIHRPPLSRHRTGPPALARSRHECERLGGCVGDDNQLAGQQTVDLCTEVGRWQRPNRFTQGCIGMPQLPHSRPRSPCGIGSVRHRSMATPSRGNKDAPPRIASLRRGSTETPSSRVGPLTVTLSTMDLPRRVRHERSDVAGHPGESEVSVLINWSGQPSEIRKRGCSTPR